MDSWHNFLNRHFGSWLVVWMQQQMLEFRNLFYLLMEALASSKESLTPTPLNREL